MNIFVTILLVIVYMGIGNVFSFMLTDDGNMLIVVLWPLAFALFVFIFILEFAAKLGTNIRKRVMKEDNKVGDKESK